MESASQDAHCPASHLARLAADLKVWIGRPQLDSTTPAGRRTIYSILLGPEALGLTPEAALLRLQRDPALGDKRRSRHADASKFIERMVLIAARCRDAEDDLPNGRRDEAWGAIVQAAELRGHLAVFEQKMMIDLQGGLTTSKHVATKAAAARHKATAVDKEWVISEWQKRCGEFSGNKSHFARTYTKKLDDRGYRPRTRPSPRIAVGSKVPAHEAGGHGVRAKCRP
jgi:hypothetical protein